MIQLRKAKALMANFFKRLFNERVRKTILTALGITGYVLDGIIMVGSIFNGAILAYTAKSKTAAFSFILLTCFQILATLCWISLWKSFKLWLYPRIGKEIKESKYNVKKIVKQTFQIILTMLIFILCLTALYFMWSSGFDLYSNMASAVHIMGRVGMSVISIISVVGCVYWLIEILKNITHYKSKKEKAKETREPAKVEG